MFEATIDQVDPDQVVQLFGPRDQHLRALKDSLGVAISHRDGSVHVAGEEAAVARATEALEQMKARLDRGQQLNVEDVTGLIARFQGGVENAAAAPGTIDVMNAARRIAPKTAGQARYVQSIRDFELTFSIGPAGTGKTY